MASSISNMVRGARTQKIPAWSKQITANGPEAMAQAFARQAAALGISTGELLRQLWIIGAKARFPKLARELIASHRKYYPSRQIMAGIVCLVTLGAGYACQFVINHHHHGDVRARPLARHLGRNNAEWLADPGGVET